MKYDKITHDITYIGVDDCDLDLFESQYSVPKGISYNSYLIEDDKVAIVDSVDERKTSEWLTLLAGALGQRKPDYLIVQHCEPDHTGGILEVLERYPECRIVCSAQGLRFLGQFIQADLAPRTLIVKEGDTLPLGRNDLRFFAAPMVHWPEVIMTYLPAEKLLFSADAFGAFGGLRNFGDDWTREARRYYVNIVGKFGVQVQSLLKKLASVDIRVICPLHGPVLRDDLNPYISLYQKWSSYTPEEHGVAIVYTTMHGNTGTAARALYDDLKAEGVAAEILDLARTPMSEAVAQAFRFDSLVVATPTYDMGLMPRMEQFLSRLAVKGYSNRRVGIVENGSWAPAAGKLVRAKFEAMRGVEIVDPVVTILSSPTAATREALASLAASLK